MGTDPAIRPDHNAPADRYMRADPATGPDLGAGLDHGEWSDLRGDVDMRRRIHRGERMDARTGRRCGMEHRGNTCPSLVGGGGDDSDGLGRDPIAHVRMHDHRAGLRLLECGGVAPVIEKADLIRSGRLQRRDAREHPVDRGGGSARRAGNGGERMRIASGEETRIAHGGFDQQLFPFAGSGPAAARSAMSGKNLRHFPRASDRQNRRHLGYGFSMQFRALFLDVLDNVQPKPPNHFSYSPMMTASFKVFSGTRQPPSRTQIRWRRK